MNPWPILLLLSFFVSQCDACDKDAPPPPPADCSVGQQRACEGGSDVGECARGTQSCDASGHWGACVGRVGPVAELCDGLDNDCDGTVDEELQRACYAGPAGTRGVGSCRDGTETCVDGVWGACLGSVLPADELCDGLDNDCDGTVDEGLKQVCYTGPPVTRGVGSCKDGVSLCTAGQWSPCEGQQLPVLEVCDGLDNDCDGVPDDSLQRSCYTGPAGTAGVGICRLGQSTCAAGAWGPCLGQVLPAPAESCNGVDDTCDGQRDEGFPVGDTCLAGGGPCGAGSLECSGIPEPAVLCSTDLGGSAFAGDSIGCGETVQDTTAGRGSNAATYSCNWRYELTGPEAVYAFQAEQARNVSVLLCPEQADLDLIVLEQSCLSESCLAMSSHPRSCEQIDFAAAAGQTYYLVVDGWDGAAGAFTMSVSCD